MSIEKNNVVVLDYKLQNGGADGDLIEETYGTDPLSFIYGIGQMIPAFEENLEQKSQGDAFSFLIKAEEGYGVHDENAVLDLPIEQFAVDGNIDRDQLQPGSPIRMQDTEGATYQGKILGVSIQHVKVDFNHPMAGVDLYFSGEIRTIREATDSELDHGHVHE
jgi:FKBP-type peptidyl-prolyl cis-trans isomerase SlyD